MTPDRDELIAELFGEAADLPETERAALLDRRCAGDGALRAEVESLLAADARGRRADFLTPPVRAASIDAGRHPRTPEQALLVEAPQIPAGERIGRYRVVRVLASGGMGTVYEATQEHPRRTVALKVIRAGIVTPTLLRRFEYEAQVLGSLQHPGVAQVYEAGAHAEGAQGVPFIAMELIPDALPIVEHAVRAELPLRARLELMARVCDAVQYAHQRGVIHRDLKPGNILVDSHGQPKIIDFGVASVTGSDITAPTLHTTPGQLLGTLRYMSPEQCEGDSSRIDTRSDVYSLGVVLFELLTGAPPYDLASTSIAGASRIIREAPPTRPSSIRADLRGDVETIILKALEKEPGRRYQTAAEFGADVRRWLADQPIMARPASAAYQLRKFARRNRPLVAGVGAALAALLAGTAGTAWQAVRATHQRDLADDARLVADTEKQKAQAEAEISRRVTAFFEDLLASADPNRAQGKKLTVQELVEQADASIGDSLKDQPLVEAGVRSALGTTFVGLGDYPRAEAHLRRAVEIRHKLLGIDAPDTLDVRSNLAAIYWMQGRLDDAFREFQAILEGTRTHYGTESTEYFRALDGVATATGARGDYARAIELNQEALEGYRRLRGPEDAETIKSLCNLAFKLDANGRSGEAEPLFREAVSAGRKGNGSDHPDTVSYMASHANCLRVLGRLDEAQALAEEVLATRRRIYPVSNHPLTGDACQLMGRVLYARGDWTGAVPYLEEALENNRASLPEGSWRVGVAAAWVGMAYTKQERYNEAERLLLEAHETLQRTKGQHVVQERGTITALVDLYKAWGKPERAAEYSALMGSP